jgi:hypothetical protein
MSDLSSYFVEAMGRIEPLDDANNAKIAHAEVSDVLKQSQALRDLGIEPKLIGSYARDVSIRRVKDVDVFGRLTEADKDLWPAKAMNLFEDALSTRSSISTGSWRRGRRSRSRRRPRASKSIQPVQCNRRILMRHERRVWQHPQLPLSVRFSASLGNLLMSIAGSSRSLAAEAHGLSTVDGLSMVLSMNATCRPTRMTTVTINRYLSPGPDRPDT